VTSKRVVVKVGSSSVADEGVGISQGKIRALVEQLVYVKRELGWQVILVSSGAVAAGLGQLGWRREGLGLPEKQAAAAIGQGVLMNTYSQHCGRHGVTVGQMLLTRSDIEDSKRLLYIRNTLETLLRADVIPIVNENDTVAVDEIRVGDNDTLSSLVAHVADADRLILLTDIDGLYTANPRLEPTAMRISDVMEITPAIEAMAEGVGSGVGTGGMHTKISAAKFATQHGIQVVVASSSEVNVIPRVLNGEKVGTIFHAPTNRLSRSY
jgi:glutamate 5-kinase